MVSIVQLPSAVETAVASGTNCTDSGYDGNTPIITTSTATSAVPAATSAAPAAASPTVITASTATKSTKSKSTHNIYLRLPYYFYIRFYFIF
jgi:hypothetical protein